MLSPFKNCPQIQTHQLSGNMCTNEKECSVMYMCATMGTSGDRYIVTGDLLVPNCVKNQHTLVCDASDVLIIGVIICINLLNSWYS